MPAPEPEADEDRASAKPGAPRSRGRRRKSRSGRGGCPHRSWCRCRRALRPGPERREWGDRQGETPRHALGQSVPGESPSLLGEGKRCSPRGGRRPAPGGDHGSFDHSRTAARQAAPPQVRVGQPGGSVRLGGSDPRTGRAPRAPGWQRDRGSRGSPAARAHRQRRARAKSPARPGRPRPPCSPRASAGRSEPRQPGQRGCPRPPARVRWRPRRTRRPRPPGWGF
jgi:hypothetical protein